MDLHSARMTSRPLQGVMKSIRSFSLALIRSVVLIVVGLTFYTNGSPPVQAQTFDPEVERQKDERDKTIPAEKLDRVRAEVGLVRDSISSLIKTQFPKYELVSLSIADPANQGSGRRGQSSLEWEWKKGKSRFGLQVTLVFSPQEAETFLIKRLKGVAMGEGTLAPESFGKDALLIKNVRFNETQTWVVLQCRKGRFLIDANYSNAFQASTENEKELLKLMEVIYPLLVAKETFEEV